ncbi:MAG: peroxiredoxin-like family protein [Verrucomicrobiota bacterium]|jgi:peroxiredoxin
MKSEPKQKQRFQKKASLKASSATQFVAARNLFSEMQISAKALRVLDTFITSVTHDTVSHRVRRAGQEAPDFILPDSGGREVRLYGELELGPVVLVFFRGGWCPFCTTYLRGFQLILPGLQTAGMRLLAVSPQLPDGSLLTREANGLEFPLLSDVGNRVARRYGVACQLPEKLIGLHGKLGLCLALANGIGGCRELPFPATFVIDTDRRIRRSLVDLDYVRRAGPKKVLQQVSRFHEINPNQ